MMPLIALLALVVLSIASPFLGEDTRRSEITRRRGSFLL
jgi:hypothetical protein